MGQGDPSASEQNSVRSASDRLSVTITATTPDSVTTGRLFTIDARTKFDAVVDGNTERVTVDLGFSVDNSQVDTKSFELLEGNTKTRSTTYALTTPGSHDVSVTATATIDGSEHTASDSTTIESNPVDLIGDTTGAAFTVPDSMQDELKDYRDKYFVDLPYAFVLARPNELYLVFSQSEPTPSEAVVSGPRLYNDLTVGDLTFKIIAATDTTFTTTGTRASVSEIANSPSEHALDLVRIDDHHERVATLYDPDSGDDVTVASTLGVLKETASSSALERPGEKVRDLAIDVRESVGDLRGKLESFVQQSDPSLTTFNLAESYWNASDSIVDAIVLPSGSPAREFLAEFDRPGVIEPSNGEALLYVVQTGFSTTSYDSVAALKDGASAGDLVEITADSLLLEVSAQETLEHATSACGEDRVEIPEAGCVNLVQDVLFEAGVCWTTLPESTDDLLFVTGLSSKHLDKPYVTEKGQYNFEGEVVSTTQFDPSLPEAKLLVVYGLSDEGKIDYAGLADGVKDRIEGRTDLLSGAVQRQVQSLANQATESWSFDTGSRLQHSAVATTESRVYLGGLGRTVYGLTESDGTTDWTFDRGGSLVDSAPAVSDDVVVIGGGDGRVYGLDATTGTGTWTFETGSAVASSPTVASTTAYVGDNRGRVYAIDRDTGDEVWTRDIGETVLADPLVDSGTVYVTTQNGVVTALDSGSGAVQWTTDLGDGLGWASPAIQNGTLYVPGDSLYALDSGTGATSWHADTDGSITATPVLWNNRVYVGTTAGAVRAFETDSQEEAWATDVGNDDRTTVSGDDSKLKVATNGSTVTLLDAFLGEPLESVTVGGEIYAPPILRNGSVYVLSGDRLTVLDTQYS